MQSQRKEKKCINKVLFCLVIEQRVFGSEYAMNSYRQNMSLLNIGRVMYNCGEFKRSENPALALLKIARSFNAFLVTYR